VFSNSYITAETFNSIKTSNDVLKTRLSENNVNAVSYDLYKSLNKTDDLHKLPLHKEHIQQACVRNALIDDLVETYEWQYWLVVTFGQKPDKSLVEDILEMTHYRIDRWLMTNNKLDYLSIADRSRWVCLPEKGQHKHLHYNCFLDFKLKPNIKTYGDEWNGIRVALTQTFKSIQKQLDCQQIDFKLYDKKRKKTALKTAIYSTKEMTSNFINENEEDHFASYIRSWQDWNIAPLNKRSPIKLKRRIRPENTLESFFK